MQIDVKNLTYVYSQSARDLAVRALDNVSLTIDEGEFFGIIGQTGSGKTTFVQHLNGLIKLEREKGEIKIGDFLLHDKKCDFKALRSKIGMVFQYPEHQLFAETVFEDVAFALKNFEKDLIDSEREERVRQAVELVGLDYQKVKDKSPFELSGGQKRRVAIAGVIVSRPEVLVLDEPAAGLDPVGKRDFLRLLHSLHKNFVKTIIIVSHDMNLVAEHCTKTAVFSHGKICKVGEPKEIFSDYGLIESLSLDLPTTAKVIKDLREKGIQIDCDLTIKDFVRAVKEKGGEL